MITTPLFPRRREEESSARCERRRSRLQLPFAECQSLCPKQTNRKEKKLFARPQPVDPARRFRLASKRLPSRKSPPTSMPHASPAAREKLSHPIRVKPVSAQFTPLILKLVNKDCKRFHTAIPKSFSTHRKCEPDCRNYAASADNPLLLNHLSRRRTIRATNAPWAINSAAAGSGTRAAGATPA